MIENEELALSVIQQFSKLGAHIHLDDFGTGYSSLSQLARFPIDAIKLDQVFVRDIHKQVTELSLNIAEKVLLKKLEDENEQIELINHILEEYSPN